MAWNVTAVNRFLSLISKGKNASVLNKTQFKLIFSILLKVVFHKFSLVSFFFFPQPIASLLQLITATYNNLQNRQKSK